MLASFEKALIASRKLVATVTLPVSASSASLSSPSLLYSCACRFYSRSNHRPRYGYNSTNRFKPSPSGSNDQDYQQSGRKGGKNALATVNASKGEKIHLPRNHPSREDERFEAAVNMNMIEYQRQFRQQIEEHGDPMDEPDPSTFSKQFDDYVEDVAVMKDKIKTRRQTKKHFSHMNPFQKEMSLLTWAEKETIRYLHDSDPEYWTPEAIADAFPISPHGVKKLVRSSMRLRTIKEVINHDTNIAERMKDIQAGKIPMTDELEKRLKIRDLCGPLKIGDLGMDPYQYVDTSLPKNLGEFASLVAPPPSKEVVKEKKNEPVVTYFADGNFYNPSNDNSTDEHLPLKPELSENELRKVLPIAKIMTFSEFEHRMETKEARKKAGDMKYMLEEIEHPTQTSSSPNEIELPYAEECPPEFPSKIQKYQRPEDTEQMVEVKVEGDQAYLYGDTVGYQKPYGPSTNGSSSEEGHTPLKIVIPEKFVGRPGATYKVKNCYYDENGDFLYKVI